VTILDTPEIVQLSAKVSWETACYWCWMKFLVYWGYFGDDDGTATA